MDLEYGMVGSVDHRAAGAAHAAAGLLRRIETLRRDENQLSGTRHSRWQMPRQAILQAMRKSQVSTESDFTQHCTLTMAALFDVVEAVNCSKISD